MIIDIAPEVALRVLALVYPEMDAGELSSDLLSLMGYSYSSLSDQSEDEEVVFG